MTPKQTLNYANNNVGFLQYKKGLNIYNSLIFQIYKKYFKGLAEKPRFKSRRKLKPSFYNDTDKIEFTETMLN
jgi:putative transposase